MSVTPSALPQIAFSRNPIPVSLQTDNYIQTPGVKAVNLVTFSAALIAAGQLIHLAWGNGPDGGIIMTCADAPDDSGVQFIPGDGSLDYVTSVLPYFEANYYLNRDFVIEVVTVGFNHCLQLTAVNNGVNYNIVPANDGLVVTTQPTAGVNQVLQPNFQQHLEVWLQQNGVLNKVYDNNLNLAYPLTGLTVKDIAPILHAYMGSDKPLISALTWQLCTGTLMQYFIKYAEYYGDAPTVKKIGQSDPVFVNMGGLDVQAALNQTLSGFLRPGGVNNNTYCLRQGSKLKLVTTEQPEWLYWINLTGADINIRLRIDIHCTDGTTNFFTTAPQTALAWQKYYIAVGMNIINIAARTPAGKTCDYYSASVATPGGSYLSQVYTYVPDNFREFPNYFVYLNSLGGYQTLYTWGKIQFESDRTKDDITLQVDYTTTAISGKQIEANIRLQDKCTVNTGYKSARDIAMLRDFLESTEKYFYHKGRLIPIGISTDNLKQPMDGDNLNAGQFVFNPLYDQFVYTDDVDLPDDFNPASGTVVTPGGYNAIVDDGKNQDDLYYD